MKRTAFALALIFAILFSSLAEIQMITSVEANPYMLKPLYCNISIQSPQNWTYGAVPILLNFTVRNNYVSDAYLYFYLLDGQDVQSGVTVEEIQVIGQKTISNDTLVSYTEYNLEGQGVLANLTDGRHNLTVFMGFLLNGTIHHANIDPYSATVYFTVDSTTISPSPLQSPEETGSESYPIALIAVATVGVVVLVGAGLLFYFKRRKHWARTFCSQLFSE